MTEVVRAERLVRTGIPPFDDDDSGGDDDEDDDDDDDDDAKICGIVFFQARLHRKEREA